MNKSLPTLRVGGLPSKEVEMATRQRTGRRTDYEWQGVGVNETSDGDIQERIIRTFGRSGTVMRVRGALRCIFATATDGDLILLAAGLLIRPEGFTALVSPLVDTEKSWIWHSFGSIAFDASFPSSPQLVWDFHIDSKAMRKVKPNDELVLMVASQDEVGTGTVKWNGGVRVLVGR